MFWRKTNAEAQSQKDKAAATDFTTSARQGGGDGDDDDDNGSGGGEEKNNRSHIEAYEKVGQRAKKDDDDEDDSADTSEQVHFFAQANPAVKKAEAKRRASLQQEKKQLKDKGNTPDKKKATTTTTTTTTTTATVAVAEKAPSVKSKKNTPAKTPAVESEDDEYENYTPPKNVTNVNREKKTQDATNDADADGGDDDDDNDNEKNIGNDDGSSQRTNSKKSKEKSKHTQNHSAETASTSTIREIHDSPRLGSKSLPGSPQKTSSGPAKSRDDNDLDAITAALESPESRLRALAARLAAELDETKAQLDATANPRFLPFNPSQPAYPAESYIPSAAVSRTAPAIQTSFATTEVKAQNPDLSTLLKMWSDLENRCNGARAENELLRKRLEVSSAEFQNLSSDHVTLRGQLTSILADSKSSKDSINKKTFSEELAKLLNRCHDIVNNELRSLRERQITLEAENRFLASTFRLKLESHAEQLVLCGQRSTKITGPELSAAVSPIMKDLVASLIRSEKNAHIQSQAALMSTGMALDLLIDVAKISIMENAPSSQIEAEWRNVLKRLQSFINDTKYIALADPEKRAGVNSESDSNRIRTLVEQSCRELETERAKLYARAVLAEKQLEELRNSAPRPSRKV